MAGCSAQGKASALDGQRTVARFDPSVRMPCESSAISLMYGSLVRPGPSAELSAVVVGIRLPQLLIAVHDERAMLCHRFTDRTTLKHEQFAGGGAIDELYGLYRIDFDGGLRRDGFTADNQRISLEKVERPTRL